MLCKLENLKVAEFQKLVKSILPIPHPLSFFTPPQRYLISHAIVFF